jgi:hypothetical protein
MDYEKELRGMNNKEKNALLAVLLMLLVEREKDDNSMR